MSAGKIKRQLRQMGRLRHRIKELHDDLKFERDGGRIYFAVDFSEVFAYLHYGERRDENVGVTLDNQDQEKIAYQHCLGLEFLFNELSKPAPLYIFPAYQIEILSYIRTQRDRASSARDLHKEFLEQTSALAPEEQNLLTALRPGTRPTEEEERKLLEIVKGKFENLCVDVSEYMRSERRGREFDNLLKNKKLSYGVEEILKDAQADLSELEPSDEEELSVFYKFPKATREDPRKRFAKFIDARALLFLRNVNHNLRDPRAKVVFVTRDTTIFQAGEKLTSDSLFGFPLHEHLRSMETVFLHLILHGKSDYEEKAQWLSDSEEILGRLQAQARRLPRKFRTLEEAKVKALERTAQLWDGHVNLQISMTVPKTPWLHEKFLSMSPPPDNGQAGNGAAGARTEAERFRLLRNLLEFISTAQYHEMADRDVKNVWANIEDTSLYMLFFRHVGKEKADAITRLLDIKVAHPYGPGGVTELDSESPLLVPALQFSSERFQNHLNQLQTLNDIKEVEPDRIREHLFTVARESMIRSSQPEAFLFMAFVLGIFKMWVDSMYMAERGLALASREQSPELHYFMAYAQRMYAAKLPAEFLRARLELYLEAYDNVVTASRIKPGEARYLKAQAAVALRYQESMERASKGNLLVGNNARRELPPTLADSKSIAGLLKEALDLAAGDRRLRVGILNDLAFTQVLSSTPALEEANRYLGLIQEEIEQNSEDRQDLLPKVLNPYLEDTRIMVAALRARETRDEVMLRECAKDLNALLSKCIRKELLDEQCNDLEAHRDIVSQWIRDVTGHPR